MYQHINMDKMPPFLSAYNLDGSYGAETPYNAMELE